MWESLFSIQWVKFLDKFGKELRRIDALSEEETPSKMFVSLLKRVYSKRKEFAPKIGVFSISRFIPDGIRSNKAQSTRKIKLFLVV